MIDITISVDTSKFDKMMADFPGRLAVAKKKALMDIGSEFKSRSEQTFRNPLIRPSPWAPRKNNADPTRPLLYKSGVMKQDLFSRLEGEDTVIIDTPHEYIKYHQFGTRLMPARPVFPLDRHGNILPVMVGKIERIVRDAISNMIKNTFGQ